MRKERTCLLCDGASRCCCGCSRSCKRILPSAFGIELTIAEVDSPVRRQEEAIENIDRQDPVERAEREFCSNSACISRADECEELPARANSGLCAVGFVGVHRPRKTEADEHPCFQELCYEHQVSVPFFYMASSCRRLLFKAPVKMRSGHSRFCGIRIAL